MSQITCPVCGEEWKGTREEWSALDHQDHKGPKTYSICCGQGEWRFFAIGSRFPDTGERRRVLYPPGGGFGRYG